MGKSKLSLIYTPARCSTSY